MEIVFDHRRGFGLDPLQARVDQFETLLACYQQVLGHDLPNRLVAVQGLARLLDQTAVPGAPLDADALALLRQVADLSRGIDAWTRRVAQIGRLCRGASSDETTQVTDVAAEVLAEAKMLFPCLAIDYHGTVEASPVRASRQAVHQALLQVLRKAATARAANSLVQATMAVRPVADGVEIEVVDALPPWAPPERPDLLRALFAGDRATEEPGLGLLQLRLLNAGWAGLLRIRCDATSGNSVLLFLPGADRPGPSGARQT